MSKGKFKIVAFLTMLPVLCWPLMMTHVDHVDTPTERFLMLAMPVYAIASGYFAVNAYHERPEVSWVLIAVQWLAYAAFMGLIYL
mgnify:CR=1 FL=1